MKRVLIFLFSIFILSACMVNKESEEFCIANPKPDCFCTYEYNPVCACNEKTYGNPCIAECHGITDYTQGECPD